MYNCGTTPGEEIETQSGLAPVAKYSCNAVQATRARMSSILQRSELVYVGKSFVIIIAVDGGFEKQTPSHDAGKSPR